MTDKNDLTEYKKLNDRGQLYRIDENGNKQTIGYFTSAEIYCPSQPILDFETEIKKANGTNKLSIDVDMILGSKIKLR